MMRTIDPNQLLKLKMKQRRNLMDYDYQNDDDLNVKKNHFIREKCLKS